MPKDDAVVKDYSTWKEIRAPIRKFTTARKISGTAQFLDCVESSPFNDGKWAFRGHSDARWRLQPRFERLANDLSVSPHVELFVEREFKRRAHQYVSDLPDSDDTLAIDRESIRWEALDMLSLVDADKNLSSRQNFKKLYQENPPDHFYLVAPVQPYRMNERLTIQQGLFFFANNNLIGFERCLKSLLHHAKKRTGEAVKWLHKFTFEPGLRLDLLATLNKMNINAATLYPGLDGFARSLRVETEVLSQKDWLKGVMSDFDDLAPSRAAIGAKRSKVTRSD